MRPGLFIISLPGASKERKFSKITPTGGGLIRSQGGWAAVKELRRTRAYQKGDERILGNGDFAEEVLRKAEEKLERKSQPKAQGFDFDKVVERVAFLLKISSAEVLAGGKKRQTVAARSLLCPA